jgi:MinD-like ATPase involved in chromosome partitioning or flagellar assembly
VSAIVVCSGKGSPGATFVAVNLAAAFARAGGETILLDLDPAGGDVCCYLGLDSRLGLYPLLRMEGSFSGSERLLAEAEERSGFRVVGGFPDASELATSDVLHEALIAADARDRTVVADLGRVSKANAPPAVEAERVLLVVRADLVSVLGAERALRHLEAAGTDRNRIAVVVSGHERRRPAKPRGGGGGSAVAGPRRGASRPTRRPERAPRPASGRHAPTGPRVRRALEVCGPGSGRAPPGRAASP